VSTGRAKSEYRIDDIIGGIIGRSPTFSKLDRLTPGCTGRSPTGFAFSNSAASAIGATQLLPAYLKIASLGSVQWSA
jgi:hypothetical protein